MDSKLLGAVFILLSWTSPPAQAFRTVDTTRRQRTLLSAEKQCTFGMGCFWEPAESLLKTDGVLSTVAGYTGNPSEDKAPDYDKVCYGRQWVEAVRVTYDDEKIDYNSLLNAFFENQKPQLNSRQYGSIIFYQDDTERKLAEEWLSVDRTRSDGVTTAMTTIERMSPFYQAEGYHQRFWQKQRPRIAIGVGLLALASGALNSFIPEQFQDTVESAANAGYVLGGLGILLERKIDNKVVELS